MSQPEDGGEVVSAGTFVREAAASTTSVMFVTKTSSSKSQCGAQYLQLAVSDCCTSCPPTEAGGFTRPWNQLGLSCLLTYMLE